MQNGRKKAEGEAATVFDVRQCSVTALLLSTNPHLQQSSTPNCDLENHETPSGVIVNTFVVWNAGLPPSYHQHLLHCDDVTISESQEHSI